MEDKSFSQIKSNIALASIATIFVGALVYVPVLKFSQKEKEIVYRNVPVPVFVNINPSFEEDSLLNISSSEYLKQQESSGNTKNNILTKNLRIGDVDPEVIILQKFLNENGFIVSASGPGSLGRETELFGRNTREALIRFQEANKDSILAPYGLTSGTGILGDSTLEFINKSLQ